jgi:hypothetical protein
MAALRYPCPCCGYLTYSEPPGSYEICSVCGWEDDLSQLRFATAGGGANDRSLLEAQQVTMASDLSDNIVGYVRDLEWRPIDVGTDAVEESEPGHDYGSTYAASETYYYWRAATTL